MTLSRSELEGLVGRIQAAFLETPALRMTLGEAARYFSLATGVCEAVMNALLDAKVLAVTPSGAYERFFPHGGSGGRASHWHAA